MAKGKKGRKAKASVPASTEPVAAPPKPEEERSSSRRFYWWDYLAVGIFVVLFCELQKFVALHIIGETEPSVTSYSVEDSSLNFFFGTIWKGFLVILILIWLYDYFYHDAEEDTA